MATGKRIACVLASGFEDLEFKKPYDRLKEQGHTVEIIGTEPGRELEGKRGDVKTRAEKGITQVKAQDYDALFIPGGHSPDQLRADERFVSFTRAFDEAGKPIGAICHGPQLLMSAGVLKGRTLTAWKTVQDDLKYTAATVKDEPVVTDRNWVTSRKPEDIPAFTDGFLKLLH